MTTTKTPRWLARHLAAAHDTDTERETFTPTRASDASLRAGFVPKWKPSTAYAAGEPVVNPAGQLVTAKVAFTSGASYAATNWTVTGGAGAATPTRQPALKGRVVLIWDDGLLTQKAAVSKLEAVGGRVNFAISTSFLTLGGPSMNAADVTELYQRGHQIMCHSVTHPNMTTQTAAQRTAEWDTSKAALEAITAVGAITDFVYPNNASNLTLQQEAYGRYLRCFTAQNAPTVLLPGENGMHIGRNTWGTPTHQSVLAWIRRIAFTGETYVLFCHDVATAGVSAINAAMLDEAIALATSLGVQFVRADEALVGHQPLFDPSFETGDLTGLYAGITSKGATNTIDIVDDAPAAGLQGSKSLRMVNDGTGTLNRVFLNGSGFVPRPGEEYTLSGRIRQDKTSGTGGGHIIARQWDEYGNNLGDVQTTAITAVGVTAWTQVSLAFTPNKLTRSLAFWCAQSAMVGTTWFDHIHIAPTRLGVLG